MATDQSNSDNARIQPVFNFLVMEGFRPAITDDLNVSFKAEGDLYWIHLDGKDKTYYRLIAPDYWVIESQEELNRAFVAANFVSRSIKHIKASVNDDNSNVSFASESFYSDVEDFLPFISKTLTMLKTGKNYFVTAMNNLKPEPTEMEHALDETTDEVTATEPQNTLDPL